MNFLPIAVNIEDEQLLIIGAGKVAWHKIELLSRYTRNIKIIAPEIDSRIEAFEGIEIVRKHYQKEDLNGHLLVYAATNNPDLNYQIKQDGRDFRCLVNVVDVPKRCDFISPAIYKQDHMSVAVTSNGLDVYASVDWRNKIRDYIQSAQPTDYTI